MKYKHRTEESIIRLKQREKLKVGNPEYLEIRRKRHSRNPSVRLRENARVRAIKKSLDFNIPTYKDIPKIPKLCPILRIPLFVGKGVSTDNSPTLDRIDNSKGYVKGNLQIISRKANQMKSNANFKEIEMLYNYMKGLQK